MKIVIFTNSDAGLCLFRKELLEELIDAGHTVVVSVPKGEYFNELTRLGCRLIETDFDRRGKNPFRELSLIRRYRRILKDERPDLVLTYTIKPNIYGGLACARAHVPYLANITGLGTEIENAGLRARLLLFLYRRGLKKAFCVFVQNAAIDRVCSQNRIAEGKRKLIPGSGVNLELHPLREYPENGDRTRFVFIGRIMKDKGVEELLSAIETLGADRRDLAFELVGDYESSEYRERICALEEQGVLTYSGYQKDVNPPLARSHALINPSYHEGISNVLLEAAATGRPVLASRVPGCAETFDDGVTGIGFEAHSADALCEAIRKFLDLSYEERRSMGLAGRQKIEREFDRRIVTNAYLEEIARVFQTQKKEV